MHLETMDTPGDDTDCASRVVEVLARNREMFLGFLQRRMASREAAEDLLQEAFARSVDRAGDVRDEEAAVAWFYRILRNALTDHRRRRDAERRALERVGREPREPEPPVDAELMDAVCTCVTGLVETLKPSYAEIVRAVDLGEHTATSYAEAQGLSRGNATVRLHRARRALRERVVDCCGVNAVEDCRACECPPTRSPDAE